MSRLDLDQSSAKFQIRAFKPGMIQINEQIYTRSVIVTPNQLIDDWKPQTWSELTPTSWEVIKQIKPAILLIGTGATHQFLSVEIYGELLNEGIGVEIMETGAACRTFNALSAEERSVVAALIL